MKSLNYDKKLKIEIVRMTYVLNVESHKSLQRDWLAMGLDLYIISENIISGV